MLLRHDFQGKRDIFCQNLTASQHYFEGREKNTRQTWIFYFVFEQTKQGNGDTYCMLLLFGEVGADAMATCDDWQEICLGLYCSRSLLKLSLSVIDLLMLNPASSIWILSKFKKIIVSLSSGIVWFSHFSASKNLLLFEKISVKFA